MKYLPNLLLYFFLLIMAAGCQDDLDDVIMPASNLEIKNFIWSAMNNMYLYKVEVPALSDDRFSTPADLDEYLNTFSSPEYLFYNGLVAEHDEFSFLVEDYRQLEKSLDGINLSNGMQYGLIRYTPTSSEVLGFVRYVLPNTSAEAKGIKRGDYFNTVDGEQLTVDNFSRLLEPRSYTIGLAEIVGDEIKATGESVRLEKSEYTSNPIYIAKTFQTSAGTVGYLMYNGFTGTFDAVLNETFAMFKAEGVTNLVVDLRYNGGGSVETASDLASMITGQFNGEIFYKEQWNENYQTLLETTAPESLLNRFNNKIKNGATINSLGLNKVYFLTTLRTASASELLINGLKPYIEIVQIGENTTGKFQASTTLYDSPNFRRNGANPGHTYAIQPLIYKTVNAAGVTDYVDGLPPDIELKEDIRNLGVLGDPSEKLLAAALATIEGEEVQLLQSQKFNLQVIGESEMHDLLFQRMYVDEALPLEQPLLK